MEELRCGRIIPETTSNVTHLPPCPAVPGPRGSSASWNRTESCGSCTTACIYNAIETCFILGVLANVFVIVRVVVDRKLRTPTFVAIAALALADLLFLLLNIARSVAFVAWTISCTLPPTPMGMAEATTIVICWFSANCHVALMAILRYIMLVYPLRSKYFVTNNKILLFSGCIWILVFVFAGFLIMFLRLDMMEMDGSTGVLIYTWSVFYLLPLVITATLHIFKMRVLRRAIQHDAVTSERRLSIQRMSKIIALVIFFAIILPFPRMIYSILVISRNFPSQQFGRHFHELSKIMILSSSFINPFIYAFLSNRFRKSIRMMFLCQNGELRHHGSVENIQN